MEAETLYKLEKALRLLLASDDPVLWGAEPVIRAERARPAQSAEVRPLRVPVRKVAARAEVRL